MANCDYFESFGPWDVVATTERRVPPFEPPNNVTVGPGGQEGQFIVTVRDPDGKELGVYTGFVCANDALSGTAEATPLLIEPRPKQAPTDKNKVEGLWDPTAATQGTWTGNESGGGGSEEDTGSGR